MATTQEQAPNPEGQWISCGEDTPLRMNGFTDCGLEELNFIKQSDFVKSLSQSGFRAIFLQKGSNEAAEIIEKKEQFYAALKDFYNKHAKGSKACRTEEDDGCFNEEEIKFIVEHSKSINIVICKGVQSVIGATTITTMDDVVAATTTTIMDDLEGGLSMMVLLTAVSDEKVEAEKEVSYRKNGLMSFLMEVGNALHVRLEKESRKTRGENKKVAQTVNEFHRYLLVPKNLDDIRDYAKRCGFQEWDNVEGLLNERKEDHIKQYLHWKRSRLFILSGKLSFQNT